MPIVLRLLLWSLVLVPGGIAAQERPRTLTIHLDAQGRLYEGPHVRISRNTLIRDLTNGLHDGAFEAVVVSAAPTTRYQQVLDVFALVKQYGPAGVPVELRQTR